MGEPSVMQLVSDCFKSSPAKLSTDSLHTWLLNAKLLGAIKKVDDDGARGVDEEGGVDLQKGAVGEGVELLAKSRADQDNLGAEGRTGGL
jgi:hypothetical protein